MKMLLLGFGLIFLTLVQADFFEPGVYVTVISAANGKQYFKKVPLEIELLMPISLYSWIDNYMEEYNAMINEHREYPIIMEEREGHNRTINENPYLRRFWSKTHPLTRKYREEMRIRPRQLKVEILSANSKKPGVIDRRYGEQKYAETGFVKNI